jgi:uncharacterized protein (DUF362 family)
MYGQEWTVMTKQLLQLAGLDKMIPRADTLIGIKPNLLGQVLSSEGATTHPEVVAGLIEYLQENGFHNIVLLEGSWVGDLTEESVRYCGYDRICSRYGVPFWDMQKEPGTAVDCAGLTLNVCKRALDIEFLINVPVLKGHCQTRITCALKNMKGLIPNAEKRRFHRMGLHEPIGHLSAGLHQDFILVDSICGDIAFEDGGNPVQQDRLIAAADPVLCDSYGCRVIGIDPESVGYIRSAAQLGLGSMDLDRAMLREYSFRPGQEPDRLPPDRKPEEAAGGYRHMMQLREMAEEVDSCSACYAYLIPALDMLRRDGLLDRLDTKVCIGQGHRNKKGKLGVGNCTRLFEHTLAGCPPTENQMYEFLKEYIKTELFQE